MASINCQTVEADPKTCKPNGKIRGKKPPKERNTKHDSNCCKEGKLYDIYKCSPQVSNHTKATQTLNVRFDDGEDGRGPPECDNKYHSNKELVVTFSTGWFNKEKKGVSTKVVNECDSTMGCDGGHSYQPPCVNNIIDASDTVWEALGVPTDQRGGWTITGQMHD
ncbi:hypothetical protein GOBAR_AA38785 [Gossypium barbadense]|uniref:Ripening-related protein n=1 Tax=Gossypium barbadense TaxID=3634 RepID=A0A2P5VT01_GOSBA|nr:hypothetical protein GOBAR_AA38785 [Gossypium barbadense]